MTESRAPTRRRHLPSGMEPRYLSREEAAAYLGVSADLFDDEVSSGMWPAARRRGSKGTRLTWDRRVLDAFADQAAGIPSEPPPPPAFITPPGIRTVEAGALAAPLPPIQSQPKLTAEAAAMKGLSNVPPRHRAKYRQPPPT
jgi:hypothetical protein